MLLDQKTWYKNYYPFANLKNIDLSQLFTDDKNNKKLLKLVNCEKKINISLKNIKASQLSFITEFISCRSKYNNFLIFENHEKASYFLDDINNINEKNNFLIFPSSDAIKKGNKDVILERSLVLKKLCDNQKTSIISYPNAIFEDIISKKDFGLNIIKVKKRQKINIDNFLEKIEHLNFDNVDFVCKPGEVSNRGLIIDVFSFGNDNPYRILMDSDIVEEISIFDVTSQISKNEVSEIDIIPNIEAGNKKNNILNYIAEDTLVWINDYENLISFENEKNNLDIVNFLSGKTNIINDKSFNKEYDNKIVYDSNIQSSFNQNFELLIKHIKNFKHAGYDNYILASSENQVNRLDKIFERSPNIITIFKNKNSLSGGFIDHSNKILIYTDHQIFNRHHQHKSKKIYKTKNAESIRDLTSLKKGDFITHFDYGIGKFDGLRIITKNGRKQESLRIIYKNGDTLYLSIHALHKISKFKENDADVNLDKIGAPRWKKLKERVKTKIKKVAFDLIKLYAKRKVSKGFAFSRDTYLQNELESSFVFQETEDQIKITNDIKKDMESESPMDRLVCGDVGFGKTEIAIRAAFKAVADNKQVAVLVPTTILALQHSKTFQKRLKNFPCNVKHINRFVNKKESTKILGELKDGTLDIIIGTHRLISKDVIFKDLGLLIVDEEQKFGVSTKDKLKTLKEHVDTLTLSATPIPRTLQFSLLGSRDLSIMTTFPLNRNPIETSISIFNHNSIKEMIKFETSRGGQVFFVHNRIANITDVHNMICLMNPSLKIKYAHGQMDSKKLENTILDFINGEFDVLVTTTIIENGLDIPNANTIIINDAQNFGLADLHQMRGRVGRSNKKAFCYLLCPPFNKIKDSGVKRLNAIVNFSSLGDGFNIAMKDLEIRGAGNMLGAEQSGYIEEMGFTNYHKILDEAIIELKEKEFKNYEFLQEKMKKNKSCIIETDLELIIPNDYVHSSTERIELYKRIDKLWEYDEITKFKFELENRFGKVPCSTLDLLNSVKLRKISSNINCIKIILKQSKMIMSFDKDISKIIINKIIELARVDRSDRYQLKNKGETLKLTINGVENINCALKILEILV